MKLSLLELVAAAHDIKSILGDRFLGIYADGEKCYISTPDDHYPESEREVDDRYEQYDICIAHCFAVQYDKLIINADCEVV